MTKPTQSATPDADKATMTHIKILLQQRKCAARALRKRRRRKSNQ